MKRRHFIKATGFATAGALIPHHNIMGIQKEQAGSTFHTMENSHITLDGNTIVVETKTLNARLEKGFITSLRCKQTGREYIKKPETNTHTALQLIYSSGVVNMSDDVSGNVTARLISRNTAEFVFHTWNGDGVLFISTDDNTGDLIIEPSAYSSRPGLLACRWNISGINDTLDLVAPFYQGVKLKLTDPLLKNTRWKWPFSWEAGLAILQAEKNGFWIHTQDDKYRFKGLQTSLDDPYTLGFDSEAFGPIDNNLSAGGVSWRINTYSGDWRVPAQIYREWYWKTYDLHLEEKKRPNWLNNVKLALSWCPGDIAILEAVAKKIHPDKVLLHYSNWRSDPYDENYPTFIPSDDARRFIKKAQQMGFHVMPHFNSIDMDPSHPVFEQMRDFSYRDVESKVLQGWSWYNGKGIGVPESNFNRTTNRDKKVMVKIHPGLGMWRSVLVENMQKAITDLSLDAAFIDVTLCIWNIHHSIVDNTTTSEGMNKLIKYVSGINNGIVVGGEGLNEITAQAQSFAQVHLFKHGAEGYERGATCDLNNFLFGKICRSFGYSGLSGRNEQEALRMKVHVDLGTIPTITINKADDIINPNAAVSEIFKIASTK